MTFILVAIVALLILGAAFLSATETAVTAASKAKLHQMAKAGNVKAKITKKIQENVGLSLSAILLCNTLLITFATSTVTNLLEEWVGTGGAFFGPLLVSAIVVVYAETLPKIIAVHQPERVLLAMVRPLWGLFTCIRPLLLAISAFARAHLWLLGYKTHGVGEGTSVEELRGIIDMHSGPGQNVRHERAMLKSILDLASVQVDEIMVHRKNVTMINADHPPQDIVDQVLASPFTRLPLWKGNPDNIIGVLNAKALLRAFRAHNGKESELDITSLANKPWFIPENSDLLEQLHAFRERREHFALVVDEYGALMGIVTLEDILEEIVGDIVDEHDILIRGIRPQEDNSVIIDGTVTIRDVNRQLEWDLPDEDAATMAGLLIYKVRIIPEIGQTFLINGYKFEVLRRHRNQITLLKIAPPPVIAS